MLYKGVYINETWVKNTILAVILVLIIAVPLLFMGGHEFGGSDDQASDAISELDEVTSMV